MTTLYISLNLVYCVYCLNAEQWKLILRTEKFRMKYLGYMHQLFCTEWHIYFTLYLYKFFKLLLTVVAVMQHNFIFKLYYRNIEFEKQWMNLYLWKTFLQLFVNAFWFSAALFDEQSGSEEAAFQRGIDLVNDDRTILSRSLVTMDVARYPQVW